MNVKRKSAALTLHLPLELKQKAASIARESFRSLNSFIVYILARSVEENKGNQGATGREDETN